MTENTANRFKKLFLTPFLILALCSSAALARQGVYKPEAYKRIDKPGRDEVSGIIKSPLQEGVYWIHGDSGTRSAVYAVNRDGEMVAGNEYKGLRLADFENKDWEDIAVDDKGHIIVGDIGNNCECRENLSLLVFKEPAPFTGITREVEQFGFRYPGERKFFGLLSMGNYDAEALFYYRDSYYLISKMNRGVKSVLFSLNEPSADSVNVLNKEDEFSFSDEVTAADFDLESNKLAVLTYTRIYIFSEFEGNDFFSGKVQTLDYRAGQTEAITFDGPDSLIMTNERGDLFSIPLSLFK